MSNMSLEESNSTSNGTLCRCSDSPLVYKDMCYLHTYDSLVHRIRGVFEVILVVWSIIYLGIAAKETTFNEKDVYLFKYLLWSKKCQILLQKEENWSVSESGSKLQLETPFRPPL